MSYHCRGLGESLHHLRPFHQRRDPVRRAGRRHLEHHARRVRKQRERADMARGGQHIAIEVLIHAVAGVQIKKGVGPVGQQAHLVILSLPAEMLDGPLPGPALADKGQVARAQCPHARLNGRHGLFGQLGVHADIQPIPHAVLNAYPHAGQHIPAGQQEHKSQRALVYAPPLFVGIINQRQRAIFLGRPVQRADAPMNAGGYGPRRASRIRGVEHFARLRSFGKRAGHAVYGNTRHTHSSLKTAERNLFAKREENPSAARNLCGAKQGGRRDAPIAASGRAFPRAPPATAPEAAPAESPQTSAPRRQTPFR